jgi:uncharacterized protein with von Willebrand factor type A (vWA) domain
MSADRQLLAFVDSLRDSGIQVSLSETEDALNALCVAPLTSTSMLRSALLTTLVKSDKDIPAFDSAFETFFQGSGAVGPGELEPGLTEEPPVLAMETLQSMLASLLMNGSTDELAAFASLVADGSGARTGSSGGGGRSPLARMAGAGYYMFHVMQDLDFREAVAEAQRRAMEGEVSGELPPALVAEQVLERAERLRAEIERQIRRLIEVRGRTNPWRKQARSPEEVDFIDASLDQVTEMRRMLPALAKRLAARLARKQGAARRGRVDIRRTIRHSMSTGGVPMYLSYKKKTPSRPELFILCDISGSVRTFSTFTLQLVYSLHQQFRSVRSFVFIDRVDEVTDIFATMDVGEAVDKAYRTADVVDGDGHSNVGRALSHFADTAIESLTPRSTVLILSDARNNGEDPRSEVLERLSRVSRKVFWLNPEPLIKWDTSDSIISKYEPHCHGVFEVRNLKQLADFVYRGVS